ncbi:MAG: EAL domain-containing protein [Pseudomonadota bacterium]
MTNASVLLVDDEPSIVNALRRALRTEGYELRTAASGQEALAVLASQSVDVVVSDYRMPGMTGTELLSAVRQRYPETVRLMLTGEADMQAVIEAINEGAIYKFLTKPWCNDTLRSTLKEACASAVSFKQPQIETSPHADFCVQLTQLSEAAQIVVLELRNPSVLRLLSGYQVAQLLVELEAIAARSLRLLSPVRQLDDAQFVFAATVPANRNGDGDADAEAQAFLRELARPMSVREQVISPRFAMGIADIAQDAGALDAQEALKAALVAVTATGFSGELTRFSSEIERSLAERHALESDMTKGLERNEFYVQVQPQVNAQTLKIEGAETLCRWRHPVLGVVSPLKFIDLAEQNGFIHELGSWVIRESWSLVDRLAELGEADLRISANVSPRQFAHDGWVDEALACVGDGSRARLLELEITESTVMDDPGRAIAVMHRLKESGFSLAMDDFGTGQSSLSLLNQLPVDSLKFDRSLVRDVTSNARSRTLFTRLIEMTQELGVKSVVEGVETQDQIELCQSIGCDLIQGFAFYRPLDVSDFLDEVRRDRSAVTDL